MCEYCENGKYIDDGEYALVTENNLIIDTDDNYSISSINFCPMCGRNLNEKGDKLL